jgi:hypothetical protein
MKILWAIFTGAVLVAAIQQPSEAGTPSTDGSWTQPFSLPFISMHAAMLPTGKVLLYSADHGVPGKQAYLLDPVTLNLQNVGPPAGWDPACSGLSFLGDGRLLVTGGQVGTNPVTGPMLTYIFNPFNEQWTRIEDMRKGRWYPSNITLGDGRIVTFTGLDETGDFNPLIELWDPRGTNNWQLLGQKVMDYYPNLHLLSNGKVFRTSPNLTRNADTYDVTNDVWTVIAQRNVVGRFDCPSVMLPPTPDRFMVMGGSARTNPPTASAEIIDLSAPSPQWTMITPMHFAREDFNSVILPNGKIFVVGGRTNDGWPLIDVLTPETFDPQTLTWTTNASHQVPKSYHSTAILLPDGRVWSGGGDYQPWGEIYSPPYLFQGTRPVIQSAPSVIQYGQSFKLSFTSSTASNRVALIRNSCATHSVNMDQRYVRLADLTNGSGTFTVTAPATANLAPPGYYMLYVIDQNGIPSVSASVHVTSEPLKILEARKTGSNVQLFWSMDFANATVQTTASLRTSATWSSPSGTPTILQGRYTITIPATSNPTLFYRLKVQLTNGSAPSMLTIPVTKSISAYASDPFCGPTRAASERKVLTERDDPGLSPLNP